MVGLSKLPLIIIILLFVCLGNQVKSDGSDHRYSVGDIVPFYANKIGPFHNSWETYAYYDLPFCSPENAGGKKLNLGEMLQGHRLVSTPYKLEFLVNKDSELLCKKRLKKVDVSRFRNAIEEDYYVQMYYDDLPIWAFIGRVNGFDTHGSIKYFLHNKFDFQILYNKDRVIEVNVRTHPNSFAELTEDKEVDMNFTYSVRWSETQVPFDKRMEKYIGSSSLPHHMTIHRHSITTSSITVIILIVCLLTFYIRVIREDISKYEEDMEEVELADHPENIGWKNIHCDVFRFPEHKSLFAAAIGSGTQLLILMAAIFVLGLMGVFQPYVRGRLLNALVIIYAITSLVSGYASVSFYCQLEGTKWRKNLLLAGGLFSGPLVLAFSFLNTIAIIYRVTAALPVAAIVMLSLLWTFLASPLLLLGAVIGKSQKSEFQAPCQTAKCPREIPRLRWYRSLLPQMALAGILPFGVIYIQLYYIFASVWGHRFYILYGILAITFLLLLIVTALVSVALTYFQLAAENHQWWWRSFFCGGSTGFFVYGYSIYYYFYRSDMNGFMQTSFFFGYMACVCYGVFLALGTVGFRASLLFVRYLYASIKSE